MESGSTIIDNAFVVNIKDFKQIPLHYATLKIMSFYRIWWLAGISSCIIIENKWLPCDIWAENSFYVIFKFCNHELLFNTQALLIILLLWIQKYSRLSCIEGKTFCKHACTKNILHLITRYLSTQGEKLENSS